MAALKTTKARIIESLKAFRAGDDQTAMTTLLEIEDQLMPSLAHAFRDESEADTRAFLVTVAWERREEQAAAFIVEALNDPVEEVWQAALNGTVALASPEILGGLKSMKQERADTAQTRRFQLCLEDAIKYVEGLLQGGQRP